jgi:hypothetical protein
LRVFRAHRGGIGVGSESPSIHVNAVNPHRIRIVPTLATDSQFCPLDAAKNQELPDHIAYNADIWNPDESEQHGENLGRDPANGNVLPG